MIGAKSRVRMQVLALLAFTSRIRPLEIRKPNRVNNLGKTEFSRENEHALLHSARTVDIIL